jgi:16S rRNA (cytidine1402-2'-O)-methyltransferase
MTALVGSGLPPVPFYFGGFLPASGSRRRAELKEAAGWHVTCIYFESPHRLLKTLGDFVNLLPVARLCVARELSKKFEEYCHGAPQEVLHHFHQKNVRGEITLIFHPDPNKDPTLDPTLSNLQAEKTPILRNLV